MSSVPNINPGYPGDRPQIVGRINRGADKPVPAPARPGVTDTVELSSEAMTAAGDADTARAERLAQIKAQIQAGTYDEDAKLTIAADRLARLFGKA